MNFWNSLLLESHNVQILQNYHLQQNNFKNLSVKSPCTGIKIEKRNSSGYKWNISHDFRCETIHSSALSLLLLLLNIKLPCQSSCGRAEPGSEIFSVNSCAPFCILNRLCILSLNICLNAREESVQHVLTSRLPLLLKAFKYLVSNWIHHKPKNYHPPNYSVISTVKVYEKRQKKEKQALSMMEKEEKQWE